MIRRSFQRLHQQFVLYLQGGETGFLVGVIVVVGYWVGATLGVAVGNDVGAKLPYVRAHKRQGSNKPESSLASSGFTAKLGPPHMLGGLDATSSSTTHK
jgi:hypothetical protein